LLPGARPIRPARRRWQVAAVAIAGAAIAAAVWFDNGRPASVPALLSASELAELADGKHSDPTAAMRALMTPELAFRTVVSRRRPATLRLEVRFEPAAAPDDARVALRLRSNVDGRGWSSRRWEALHVPAGASHHFTYDLFEVLGDGRNLRTPRLEFELDARIVRHAGSDAELVRQLERAEPSSGSRCTWQLRSRTVMVYDEFPSDYPERRTDPELDARMRVAWTPAAVVIQPTVQALRVMLDFRRGVHQDLVPLAGEMSVGPPDGDIAVARGRLLLERPVTGEDLSRIHILLDLQPEPTADEQRFLLGLESGTIERVRLRHRPSRDLALEHTEFNAYWGGELDMVVPVQYLR
jgi:hypothetical protein